MNLIDSVRRYRRFRTMMTELNAYSNRELADLGIDRAGIRKLAKQSV